jgi:antitoxin component YwqK of YwqJK toxin-antitoxin module
MHGKFLEWNEQGDLISKFEMNNGTGRRQVYHNSGRLILDEPLVKNFPHGVCMEVSPTSEMITIINRNNGKVIGRAFDFYPTYSIRAIVCYSESGRLHGPCVHFSNSGDVSRSKWYIADQEVTKSAYATAASLDQTLVPYSENAQNYRDLIDDKVKALLNYC